MSDKPNGFTIAGRLPSLNDYINACRSHWSKGAALKRETEDAIIWHIISAKSKGTLRPVSGPVAIAFEWHESDKRRDLDNIISAKSTSWMPCSGPESLRTITAKRCKPGGYPDRR